MRISNKLRKDIEAILRKSGYNVIYGKGRFRGGFCILEDKKMIVLNKFFPPAAQINILTDLVKQLPINKEELDEKELSLLNKILEN